MGAKNFRGRSEILLRSSDFFAYICEDRAACALHLFMKPNAHITVHTAIPQLVDMPVAVALPFAAVPFQS